MLMMLAELKYRADNSTDSAWAERYRVALRYDLPNPVDLDVVNRILAGKHRDFAPPKVEAESQPSEAEAGTWRDRKGLL